MTKLDQGWPLSNVCARWEPAAETDQRSSADNDEWRDREGVRSVFISDIHLGNRHAQIEPLLDFLEGLRPDRLYLVGDIVDGWELQRGSNWPESCTTVLRRFMSLADRGTELFYTPGNHDSFLRKGGDLRGLIERFGCLRIEDEFVAQMADGRRLLVTHGDLFDFFETSAQWISKLLGVFYQGCLSANWWLSRSRSKQSQSPYRLCAVAKQKVKQFVRFISRYEASLMNHARQRKCDGVICGHVHTPSFIERDGMIYCNTGDWMENCTAIVEQYDGTLELRQFYAPNETRVILPRTEGREASGAFSPHDDEFAFPYDESLIPSTP